MTTWKNRLRSALLKRLIVSPVMARHQELSMIASADDEPGRPTSRLLDLASRAIGVAASTELRDLSSRLGMGPKYSDVWPGEHYRLLAAITSIEKPRLVVEVGTYQGLSALSIKKFLPLESRLVTFDIIEWKDIGGTLFNDSDFADGCMVQEIGDLSDSATFNRHKALLGQADFIFVDAPKDGRFESVFLDHAFRGDI